MWELHILWSEYVRHKKCYAMLFRANSDLKGLFILPAILWTAKTSLTNSPSVFKDREKKMML